MEEIRFDKAVQLHNEMDALKAVLSILDTMEEYTDDILARLTVGDSPALYFSEEIKLEVLSILRGIYTTELGYLKDRFNKL